MVTPYRDSLNKQEIQQKNYETPRLVLEMVQRCTREVELHMKYVLWQSCVPYCVLVNVT